MKNRRESERSYTYAKVVLWEFDTIGYLRDISPAGMRIEVFDKVDFAPQKEVVTTIIPHQDLKIDPFNITSEIKWIGENGPTASVGLEIESFENSETEKMFRRLYEVFRKTT
ncbi:MAG: PilZ domain-containing protein [Spirochaetaceae bacterium]